MSLVYAQVATVDTFSSLPTSAMRGQIGYCSDVNLVYTFDGVSWIPSNRTTIKKAGANVNAKTTGSTLLYTLEASNFNFYPIMVVPRNVNIMGVTTPPTISIGSNSTAYNNIATASLLSSLLSTLTVGSGAPQMTTFSPALAGGTQIYSNVTIAAVATNYVVLYDILGFYDT